MALFRSFNNEAVSPNVSGLQTEYRWQGWPECFSRFRTRAFTLLFVLMLSAVMFIRRIKKILEAFFD